MLFKEELDDFRVHMEHKLLVHKNKGGFERLSIDELIKLLHAEVRELKTSLEEGTHSNTIRECADIANYAMMISSKIQNRKEV